MYRVAKWLDRGKAAVGPSTGLDVLAEARNLESALKAAELILDDDIAGAEERLAAGDSAFHKLARGTLGFVRATLGFEQDAMKEATDLLYEAETSATAFQAKAQQDSSAFTSNIYDRGSEFTLCQAEAQIMSAVVGVLNESLTDSIKGFYKLRKAYMTLNSLIQMEQNYMKTKSVHSLATSPQTSVESLKSTRSTQAPVARSKLRNETHVDTADVVDDDDSEDDFYEADDVVQKDAPAPNDGDVEKPGASADVLEEKLERLQVPNGMSPSASGATSPAVPSRPRTPLEPMSQSQFLTADADSEVFSNSLDVFIHSGVNLMSGMLNLMIAVIPPAFGRLLSIVGFRGDRERGLRMLWQATKFHNINGGMAALILCGWYNGFISFCDIISDPDPTVLDEVNGYPLHRLQSLLVVMRSRYPESFLWKLEEARAHANKRQLDEAISLLSGSGQSQLKQLEALRMFEKSISAMNAHHYDLCAESFLVCVDLNKWSQALYYYIAAAAYLQIYRDLKDCEHVEDQDKATKCRDLAEKHFLHAPQCVGKKKMLGRQLPFDTFVLRKINKWQERARIRGCSFIEAVGVAPIEEICMLWNGHKKMNVDQLHESLDTLQRAERQTTWAEEEADEKAIQHVLKAVVLRNLKRYSEAKAILQGEILDFDANAVKGPYKDAYMGPMGHYEMACNLWMERSEYKNHHGEAVTRVVDETSNLAETDVLADAKLVREAKVYLEKAKNWSTYELDTRIGMKITAGLGAVARWEAKHGATK